jgi:hypothetical protein
MKTFRRRVTAAALALMAAVGGILVAGTAYALPVTTGSLSFSGDRHDSITQGLSYSYSTGNGDTFVVVDGDHAVFADANTGVLHIAVDAANGDRWSLVFIAPSGRVLTPGTYTVTYNTSTADFRPGPGLELGGNSVACRNATGSFTITRAVFSIGGYVQNFDATFEQQCVEARAGAAARGEVHISNPALNLTPKPAPTGTTTAGAQPSIGVSGPAPTRAATAGTQPSIAMASSPKGDVELSSGDSSGASSLWVWVGVSVGIVFVVVTVAVIGIVMGVRHR